ncbi:MAG: hypothetical protein R3C18_03225 [Planctomycetaceae bacterium]
MRASNWVCLILFLWMAVPGVVHAQRREFVEDLLRTLIESQTRRDQDRDRNPPNPNEQAPPPRVRPNPQANAIDVQLDAMSKDTMQLAVALQYEVRSLPELRPVLGRLLQMEASLDALTGRNRFDRNTLTTQFAAIDRDWRWIEYRLNQTTDAGRQIRQLVTSVSEHERKLCELLGVEPQLDRPELLRVSGELTTKYRQLMEAIYRDLPRNPRLSGLLGEGQQLQIRYQQMTALINFTNYSQLATEFKNCQLGLVEFRRKLHPVATDDIRRNLFLVEESSRELQELLWIPIEFDDAYLDMLVHTAEADARQLLASIAVPDLLAHPDATRALQVAREFDQSLTQFVNAVHKHSKREALLWDYRLLDVQWSAFAGECQRFPSPLIQQQAIAVGSRFELVGKGLGFHTGYDRGQLVKLVSRLDELCFQFEQAAEQQVLNAGGYPPQFRNRFQASVESLHEAAHTLHEEISTQHVNPVHIREHAEQLVKSWQNCKTHVANCRPDHQQILYQVVAQTEPLMVQLQVLFTTTP